METHDDDCLKADLDRVIQSIISGDPLDPETQRRVRERSEKAQQELLQKHGVREIAVELVREIRDEG